VNISRKVPPATGTYGLGKEKIAHVFQKKSLQKLKCIVFYGFVFAFGDFLVAFFPDFKVTLNIYSGANFQTLALPYPLEYTKYL